MCFGQNPPPACCRCTTCPPPPASGGRRCLCAPHPGVSCRRAHDRTGQYLAFFLPGTAVCTALCGLESKQDDQCLSGPTHVGLAKHNVNCDIHTLSDYTPNTWYLTQLSLFGLRGAPVTGANPRFPAKERTNDGMMKPPVSWYLAKLTVSREGAPETTT